MPLELPLNAEVPVDVFSVVLDGQLYRFRAMWNARAERWTLEIQTSAGAPLVSAELVQADAPIFALARADLPPGRFLTVDRSGSGRAPGRDELGQRVVLLYFTAAELEEASA